MNILFLHSSSDLYGASKILLQTVVFLQSRGHRVIVVLSEEGALADELRAKNCSVCILKLGILRRKYFNIKGVFNRISTVRKAIKTLGAIADSERIDIIYSNTTTVFAGAFVAKKKKIRHIWHIHEIITKPAWLLKGVAWMVNRYSHQVVVVSEAVKKYWEASIDPAKISVIYNGLDYTTYLNASGDELRKELASGQEMIVGMIGRVHPWKGQEYFLQICKKVLDVHPSTRFVMVGDVFPGNEYLYERLENIKSELGIGSNIRDLGFRRDIPQILAALDIFMLPSTLPDPLPTVVLEAMASAKPVVATRHGGAMEMVKENETGFLVPWDNAAAAAKRIIELLDNPQQARMMGQDGRKRVLNFFSEQVYLANIEKLINGK